MQALFSNRLALWLLVLAVPAFGSADKAQLARPEGTGTIEVTVEVLSSTDGNLLVSLYLTDEGYPDEWQRAFASQRLPATEAVNGVMSLQFDNVPAGWFVISVLHDEDGNNEMSTNAFGMPKEAYGFSQNPKTYFGPPDFDKAAVWLEAGQVQAVSIQLK